MLRYLFYIGLLIYNFRFFQQIEFSFFTFFLFFRFFLFSDFFLFFSFFLFFDCFPIFFYFFNWFFLKIFFRFFRFFFIFFDCFPIFLIFSIFFKLFFIFSYFFIFFTFHFFTFSHYFFISFFSCGERFVLKIQFFAVSLREKCNHGELRENHGGQSAELWRRRPRAESIASAALWQYPPYPTHIGKLLKVPRGSPDIGLG